MRRILIRKIAKVSYGILRHQNPRLFSVGICNYKPGYKSHDLLWILVLSLEGNLFLKRNPLQDFLSSLNAVISTNDSTWFIIGHVIYNPAYIYKFQLKTTLIILEHQSKHIRPMCSLYLSDSDQKQYLTISIDYTIYIFVSMVSMDYHYLV